jgi:hypothetical protein
MGEGFIVRRGGGGQQTVKPIYNSLTAAGLNSLTLSVTNDSNSIAPLYYSVVNNEPGPDQANTFETEFAGKETKDITITGLTSGTTYTVYLKAIVIGEFPSETVIVTDLTTGVPMQATGGTITTPTINGIQYKVHTFTNVGTSTFTVTDIGALGGEVDYLIVGGGGSGGGNLSGGGGGGGVISNVGQTVNVQNYTITVGNGGASVSSSQNGVTPNSGQNSSAFGLTAIGGGGGGGGSTGFAATSGGSGGGGGGYVANPGGAGTPGQGFAGGTGGTSAQQYRAGGGGGANGVGGTWSNSGGRGGFGGPGIQNNIDGNNYYYGAGGGGGSYTSNTGGGNGGIGGGGGGGTNSASAGAGGTGGRNPGQAGVASNNGAASSVPRGGNAGANTGSGGGGAGHQTALSGQGGSGIVLIRYLLQEVS